MMGVIDSVPAASNARQRLRHELRSVVDHYEKIYCQDRRARDCVEVFRRLYVNEEDEDEVARAMAITRRLVKQRVRKVCGWIRNDFPELKEYIPELWKPRRFLA